MIKLLRPKCPNLLKLKTDYKYSENKEALKQSTHGKCMYCETKITASEHGDVEHIKPKSLFPELTYDWDNLGFACEICNRTYKNDNYDDKFINPYVENPEEFLDAIGAFIVPKNGNDRGLYSCDILGLNRIDLEKKRNEEIVSIKKIIDELLRNPNINVRSSLINELKDFIREESEYSFVKRKFIEEYFNKVGITI